jgi:tetratricopeptide (TPR) repeat protein
MLTKNKKIILIIVLIIILAGGLLAVKVWLWQGKLVNVKSIISQIFPLKEELPENVKQAVDNINNNPTDINSYLTVASYKRDKGQYEDAIKIYNAAIEIRPTDTLLLMNAAELYVRNKQYTEAEENYLKVIDTNPKWTNAYRNLAGLYRYNLQEKRTDIPKILELGLKNNEGMGVDAEFVGQLAVYYEDFGPKDKAIEYFEKLVVLDPTNETAKNTLERLKSGN